MHAGTSFVNRLVRWFVSICLYEISFWECLIFCILFAKIFAAKFSLEHNFMGLVLIKVLCKIVEYREDSRSVKHVLRSRANSCLIWKSYCNVDDILSLVLQVQSSNVLRENWSVSQHLALLGKWCYVTFFCVQVFRDRIPMQSMIYCGHVFLSDHYCHFFRINHNFQHSSILPKSDLSQINMVSTRKLFLKMRFTVASHDKNLHNAVHNHVSFFSDCFKLKI